MTVGTLMVIEAVKWNVHTCQTVSCASQTDRQTMCFVWIEASPLLKNQMKKMKQQHRWTSVTCAADESRCIGVPRFSVAGMSLSTEIVHLLLVGFLCD